MADVIATGRKAKALLDDEVVGDIVLWLDKQYWTEFKAATTDETRRMAQAKALAVEDLMLSLRRLQDAGYLAEQEAERHERRPTAAP